MKRMLNLGCGLRFHPDFINVDLHAFNEDVVSQDITGPLRFEDNAFDVVYHSHLLEHLSRQNGAKFLKECHRICKPGGVIRVVVPQYHENLLNIALGCERWGNLG